MFAMFLLESTYICEQILIEVKNKTRRKILDEHLENILRIATACGIKSI